MDIKWQRGNYIKFIALMKVRVGGNTPLDIQNGDEFEFDGSILKYSGMEINQPQIRGAIISNWAKLADDDESDGVEAIRPSRNIAKAQTVNRDLNRVQRLSGVQINTSQQDEDEVLRVNDRSTGNSPRIITAADSRKNRLAVNSDAHADQQAVTIGRVRTSAKQTFNDVSKSEAGAKLKELENISHVKAELFDKTIEKEGVSIKTNIGNVNRIAVDETDDGEHVGHVRNSNAVASEGILTKAAPKKVVVSPKKIDVKVSPRVRVARSIYPDFPADWVFEGKLADRLAAVMDVNPTPEFLEALFAAEGDQFRKVLIKEFPDQFGG